VYRLLALGIYTTKGKIIIIGANTTTGCIHNNSSSSNNKIFDFFIHLYIGVYRPISANSGEMRLIGWCFSARQHKKVALCHCVRGVMLYTAFLIWWERSAMKCILACSIQQYLIIINILSLCDFVLNKQTINKFSASTHFNIVCFNGVFCFYTTSAMTCTNIVLLTFLFLVKVLLAFCLL